MAAQDTRRTQKIPTHFDTQQARPRHQKCQILPGPGRRPARAAVSSSTSSTSCMAHVDSFSDLLLRNRSIASRDSPLALSWRWARGARATGRWRNVTYSTAQCVRRNLRISGRLAKRYIFDRTTFPEELAHPRAVVFGVLCSSPAVSLAPALLGNGYRACNA